MNEIILIIVISYFIGNFQTSYILGKTIKKTDIRQFGSGNAGTTNALRIFGKKVAAATLLLDAVKGSIAVIIGKNILGDIGAMVAGLGVVSGHNWPVFLKFKGGKGIATTIGVALVLLPLQAIICIIIGIMIIVKTRYVSLGTMSAIVIWPIVYFIGNLLIKMPIDGHFFILTIVLAIMAIYKHKSNIVRLLKGEELRIGKKS